jgi:glycosyltransferase involved in cell wall biosynthesis
VSIVLPAFNAKGLIGDTIATVLQQTFTDFELLVVDDGSMDGTALEVQSIAAKDPRCQLIVQRNRGPSSARNRGIAEASGDLIAFMDHDDYWHPDKLALQVQLLDSMPDVGVVTCFSAVIDEDRRFTGWRLGDRANGWVYEKMVELDLVSGGSVAIVRRSALAAAGTFDESLRFREDWDMWIRLARCVPFQTVPQTLVGYTRRAGNASSDYEKMAAEGAYVLRKVWAHDATLSQEWLRFCTARDLFAIACLCAMDSNSFLAWQYLARCCAVTPAPLLSSPRRWAFVGVLVLQSILPSGVFRFVFGLAGYGVFGVRSGRRFAG